MTGATGDSPSLSFLLKMTKFYSSRPTTPPSESINGLSDLLQSNFIVGEAHSDPSPKNFLIQNMVGFSRWLCKFVYTKIQKDKRCCLRKMLRFGL